MLTLDCESRLTVTVREVLEHKWVKEPGVVWRDANLLEIIPWNCMRPRIDSRTQSERDQPKPTAMTGTTDLPTDLASGW
jgi:hypothetical protein